MSDSAKLPFHPAWMPRPVRDEDYIQDFDHENGRYENECLQCKRRFYGHKRRHTCRICAVVEPQGAADDRDLWGRIRAAIMHAFSQESIGYEKASANAEWATNKIIEELGSAKQSEDAAPTFTDLEKSVIAIAMRRFIAGKSTPEQFTAAQSATEKLFAIWERTVQPEGAACSVVNHVNKTEIYPSICKQPEDAAPTHKCGERPVPCAIWTGNDPNDSVTIVGNVFVCANCQKYLYLKVDTAAEIAERLREKGVKQASDDISGAKKLAEHFREIVSAGHKLHRADVLIGFHTEDGLRELCMDNLIEAAEILERVAK